MERSGRSASDRIRFIIAQPEGCSIVLMASACSCCPTAAQAALIREKRTSMPGTPASLTVPTLKAFERDDGFDNLGVIVS